VDRAQRGESRRNWAVRRSCVSFLVVGSSCGMTPVKDIFDAVMKLDERRDRIAQGDRAQRDRAAAWLDKTADTLDRVVTDLRRDVVPHGACDEMLLRADDLVETLGDQVGTAYAEETARLLRDAHEVEMLIAVLDGDPARDKKIAQLDRAAGMLRVDADYVRVTS
jgi:hypothetical protein